jgi:hypothetical protein
MKKVNEEYKEAYKEYKKRLKNRPHKWGETKCLVCSVEFQKTTGKHFYCSNECRRINALKIDLDISNEKANAKTLGVDKSSWNAEFLKDKSIAIIAGLAIYEQWIINNPKDKKND